MDDVMDFAFAERRRLRAEAILRKRENRIYGGESKREPWYRAWVAARYRCNNPKERNYGAKGIRCLITKDEVKFLWNRDGADNLKQPSLDRLDSKKDYTLSNCRFIEFDENRRLGAKQKRTLRWGLWRGEIR